MKSSGTHFIVALVLGVAALAGYGVWYRVTAGKSVAAADIEAQIRAKTETAARVSSARAELSELTDAEALVQSYVVAESDAPVFIEALEARGRAQGSVVTVSSVATTGTSPATALALTVTITGSFDSVMRTVGAIEYSPYAIVLSSLTLAPNGSNAWRADLKLTVSSVPGSRKVIPKNASGTQVVPDVATSTKLKSP